MTLLLDFFMIVGITITILVLYLLFRQKAKQLPQRILIILFIFILFLNVYFYALVHDLALLELVMFFPRDIIGLLVGPLMLLYVKSLFVTRDRIFKNFILHVSPLIVYTLFLALPTLINDMINHSNTKFILEYLKLHFEYGDTEADFKDIYMIFYFALSLKQLKKYRIALKSNYSTITNNDLDWIRYLLISIMVVVGIDLVLGIYVFIYGELNITVSFVVIIVLNILISYLGYHGTSKSRVLLPDFLVNEDTSNLKSKSNKNVLKASNPEHIKLKLKLDAVLKNEKPYLETELTLAKLAELIQTSDKKLSALLNQHMNISFYDLINKYRIDAVKELIESKKYENLTLLGIAFECGFNSKTSFNRIFRKETGLSPSAYRKQL